MRRYKVSAVSPISVRLARSWRSTILSMTRSYWLDISYPSSFIIFDMNFAISVICSKSGTVVPHRSKIDSTTAGTRASNLSDCRSLA
jgi:hypothetical protein